MTLISLHANTSYLLVLTHTHTHSPCRVSHNVTSIKGVDGSGRIKCASVPTEDGHPAAEQYFPLRWGEKRWIIWTGGSFYHVCILILCRSHIWKKLITPVEDAITCSNRKSKRLLTLTLTTGMSLRSDFLTMVARSWRCEERKALYVAVSPMERACW